MSYVFSLTLKSIILCLPLKKQQKTFALIIESYQLHNLKPVIRVNVTRNEIKQMTFATWPMWRCHKIKNNKSTKKMRVQEFLLAWSVSGSDDFRANVRGVLRTLLSICESVFWEKNWRLNRINFFRKKVSSQKPIFWTNFTTHFTKVDSTFIRIWPYNENWYTKTELDLTLREIRTS